MTDVAAPPPPAADTQESTPTTEAPKGHAAKMAQAVALLGRRSDGKFTPAPPGAKPPPAVVAPPKEPAAATPAPEDALRVAREQQDALRISRERVEARKAAEQAQAKLAELAVFEGKDPRAIVQALKARGVTLEQLAKGELDSEDEPEEDPRVRQLREEVEALKTERQREAEAAAKQKNLATVSKVIADATELPLLQGYGSAANIVLQRCQKAFEETGEAPDVGAIAAGYQKDLEAELDQILSTDAALEAWLSRPEVKQRALKALKVKNPSAGPASDEGANGPGNDASAANSSTAAAGGAPRQARTLTHEDRRAAALDDLRKRMGNRS